MELAARRTCSSNRRWAGPEPSKLSNPTCFVKLPAGLQQLDVEPAGVRIGNTVAIRFAANHTEQSDQSVVCVNEGPELDPAPDPLSAGVKDQDGGSGRLAVQ